MYKIIRPPDFTESDLKGNKIKDVVQEKIANTFNTVNELVVEAFTGFGKTRTAIKCINTLNPKHVIIIVPKETLLQQWLTVSKLIINKDIKVSIYIINTYTMSSLDIDRNCDLLIVDEAHRVLNEDSQYFSTTLSLTKAKKTLLLSASLENKHKQFLNFTYNISTYYQISRYWGFKHNLVPSFTIINIPIDLTLDEMFEYTGASDLIEKYKNYLARVGIYDPFVTDINIIQNAANDLDITQGQLQGILNKYRAALNKRKTILYNAENKKSVSLEILNKFPELFLVFCKSIDFANELSKEDNLSTVFHSKLTKKEKEEALNLFYSYTKPHLISIDGLKEGFDIVKCRFALRTAYSSVSLDTIQIGGRILRFDEEELDKQAVMFCLYVRGFTARNKTVKSQEEEWLRKNQKNESNILWMSTALEALEYIENNIV